MSRSMRLALPLLGLSVFVAYVALRTSAYHERLEGPEALGTLEAEVISQSDVLGIPLRVAMVGDQLAVIDEVGDHAVHLVDPADGSIQSLGGRGDGPCEFRSPFSIDVDEGGDGFWVYDLGLARLSHIVSGGEEGYEWGCAELLRLESEAPLLGPLWLRDRTTIVSLGLQSQGRLAYFDGAGRPLRVAGEIPGAEDGTPVNVRQHAYRGELRRKPDGSTLAVALRHAGWIELLSPDGRSVGVARGPEEFRPVYEVVNAATGPVMGTSFDLRFGYVDVATTEDYILGLYSGLARGEVADAYMGRQIHLFDWSGDFLGAWRLDTPVISIAVSEIDATIYAVRHDPSPAIVAFGLPDLPALLAGSQAGLARDPGT